MLPRFWYFKYKFLTVSMFWKLETCLIIDPNIISTAVGSFVKNERVF